MSSFKIGDRVRRGWADGEFVIFWKGKCKFSGRVRYGAKRDGDGGVVWGYARDFGLVEAKAEPAPAPAAPPKVYKMSVAPRSEWKVVEHRAEAYGDAYVYEAPFSGEFSEVEARELVWKPRESSWGALRWSGGASLCGFDLDRKVVKVSEYVAMCD